MNFNYTIGVTSATRNEQCNRCFFCGGTNFTDYKLSKQNTFFTAYSECNGYNHFNVINIITDAFRLFDILPRFNFLQFLILVDGMNRLANIV